MAVCSKHKKLLQSDNIFAGLVSIIYVACLAIQVNVISAGCETKWSDTALVSALLPLHGGDDCSQVNLRSVQQLAAIKDAIKEVNMDIKMQDGLSLSMLDYLFLSLSSLSLFCFSVTINYFCQS